MTRRKSTLTPTTFFDEEERTLITSIEHADAAGKLRPVKNQKARIAQAEAGARRWLETERKDARVNIRLKRATLAAFKARAAKEGFPYQVLMASLIHRYAFPEPEAIPVAEPAKKRHSAWGSRA